MILYVELKVMRNEVWWSELSVRRDEIESVWRGFVVVVGVGGVG